MLDQLFHGIVLEKTFSRETDSLVILYTKEFGKIGAVAQGTKKIISKLNPHLEPLNFLHGRIVEKKTIRLVDAIAQDPFRHIRSHPFYLDHALGLLRYTGSHTAEFEKDENAWQFLLNSLRFLNQAACVTIEGGLPHPETILQEIYHKFDKVLGYK